MPAPVDAVAVELRRDDGHVLSYYVATEESLQQLDQTSENKLELVGVSGGGGGGQVASFGTTSGSGSGISAKFYGSGGNARKIIYVIDASGSLIDTLPFVINELKRSISQLSSKQEFTVIFFQSGTAIEVPPRGWKTATSEVKQKVADWITLENGNIIPQGSTNPIQADRKSVV